MDIFEKCGKFTAAKEIMAAGFYPYFNTIESAQDRKSLSMVNQ